MCVGERREGSEGLISLGCGRGHLRAESGLRGVGVSVIACCVCGREEGGVGGADNFWVWVTASRGREEA